MKYLLILLFSIILTGCLSDYPSDSNIHEALEIAHKSRDLIRVKSVSDSKCEEDGKTRSGLRRIRCTFFIEYDEWSPGRGEYKKKAHVVTEPFAYVDGEGWRK